MRRIHQFAANLLSYIPTTNYWNWSTFDSSYCENEKDEFFWNTVAAKRPVVKGIKCRHIVLFSNIFLTN